MHVRCDAVTCSTACRQARWRHGRQVQARASTEAPVRLAIADPPYPGLSGRYYAGHPDFAGEVDHDQLLERLRTFDGWALATSAEAASEMHRRALAWEPSARLCVWVRGKRPHLTARGPRQAWEAVIVVPARRLEDGPADALVHGVSPMVSLPGRVVGAKPAAWCSWVFGLLGAQAGDELEDLFPGSGAVGLAWDAFRRGAQ